MIEVHVSKNGDVTYHLKLCQNDFADVLTCVEFAVKMIKAGKTKDELSALHDKLQNSHREKIYEEQTI